MNETKIKEIILDRTKKKISTMVGAFTLESIDVDVIAENISMGFIAKFEAEVLSQEAIEYYEFEFDIPANWWEQLKNELMPKWFLRIFPVKYRKVTQTKRFKHMAFFPDVKKIFPPGERVVFRTVVFD